MNSLRKEKASARMKAYNSSHSVERTRRQNKWLAEHLDEVHEYNKRWARTSPRGRLGMYKNSAKERGVAFNLTFEQFMSFWQKPCIVGCKIDTIGLDRIDNSKGYEINNVRPMCKKHNLMKNHFSDQELIEFGKVLGGRS